MTDPATPDPGYAETARQFLDQFTYTYPVQEGGTRRFREFRFEDTWELDFTDWHWSFLWACNAIQWGVGQYDAAKAPAGSVAA